MTISALCQVEVNAKLWWKAVEILWFFLFLFCPTAFKGCVGIVFICGIRKGGRLGSRCLVGKSLSGLYLRNHDM